jgi:hypothetical protein
MVFLRRIGPILLALSLLVGVLVPVSGKAQSSQSPVPAASAPGLPATILRVKVVLNQQEPAIEINSSRPIVPTAKKLEGPPRLVIDLPNANMSLRRKRIGVNSPLISAVRLDQYQKTPPVVRVVVDLLQPSDYTVQADGNRLTIRLRAEVEATLKPPSVPAFTRGVQAAVVPITPGASGLVVMAGNRLASGSSVTAGVDTAILSLGRGGEVRVCPGTTVSVTSSQNGRELMLGMSTGALEAHYALDASADSILTPDFRILLAGPGVFHYAISADSRGNTCVRALPGNAASAIVSELMGDGTYLVKPEEQVVFHSGRLSVMDNAVPEDCGCIAAPVPVMRAATPSGPVVSEADLPPSVHLAQPGEEVKPLPPPESVPGTQAGGSPPSQAASPAAPLTTPLAPETAALPAPQPNEVHVQVEAPFIYRAGDAPPAPTGEAGHLPVARSARPAPLVPVVLPPPAEAHAKPQSRGFFGKVKGFFAAIFR